MKFSIFKIIFCLLVVPLFVLLFAFHVHIPILPRYPIHLTVYNVIFILLFFHGYFFATGVRLYSAIWTFGGKISLFKGCMIGQQALFYFFAIPTTVGYEVARYAKVVSVATHISKTKVMSAVFLDRMVGALASLLLFLVFAPQLLRVIHYSRLVILLLVSIVLILGLVMIVSTQVRAWLSRFIKVVYTSKGKMLILLVLGIMAQLLQAYMLYWGVSQLWHISVSFSKMIAIQSLGNLVSILPVSAAGIGMSEVGVFTVALLLGYNASVAGLISALLYFSKLLGAFEGGAIEFIEGGVRLMKLKNRMP